MFLGSASNSPQNRTTEHLHQTASHLANEEIKTAGYFLE